MWTVNLIDQEKGVVGNSKSVEGSLPQNGFDLPLANALCTCTQQQTQGDIQFFAYNCSCIH